jgi:hypothetical protein
MLDTRYRMFVRFDKYRVSGDQHQVFFLTI